MWFSVPAWPFLLLLFLLPSSSRGSKCPESCSCLLSDSIFCMERRSSHMPSSIPASTKHLYVFQNDIETLSEDDFIGLEGLESLDLSQNELVELPDGVFGHLSSLRNLDLSSNQIAHVSERIFSGLVELERLYLFNNRIQTIHPATFEGLEKLLELKLQLNAFTVLPPIRLPRLLLLDISHNRIRPPSAADLQSPNLECLKMAGLGLTDLDEELMSSMTNLHDLDLSQNQLSAMPPALKSARGLISLSLASNQLGQLAKEDFENLGSLQQLDLSHLNLQGFPEGFFQLFPRLHDLTAAENPFNCLCPLAWFPSWLRSHKVELGRKEETRCHFPPSNAGRVLVELDHKDFGCPVTTTVATRPPVVCSTLAPPSPTARAGTTTPALPSYLTPSREAYDGAPHHPPAASPSSAEEGHEEVMCPSNICLNGGTCKFNQQGQVECLCPSDTTGLYCEDLEESPSLPSSPGIAVITAASPEPHISSGMVTSTSILIDLHRYIETRPHIRGIRLTYRNLSGPDQRPHHLSIPVSYPEYTLRGLRPNSTYLVCASNFGESDTETSCTEARTAGSPVLVSAPPHNEGPVVSSLVLALAGLALVMVVMACVLVVRFIRRRKQAKAHVELDAEEPTPLELEGVKACLENGGVLPQKQPEITPCPPQTPNGIEYEALLVQGGQGNTNNNLANMKPSYF
ncbi:hypothetical protein ACEWY4_017991 [Coilia grayii]|uniref:Vasorin n=1 Tax=Coilia grayii TaxID=363190 RepID=A0ABD1JIC7_9TELE